LFIINDDYCMYIIQLLFGGVDMGVMFVYTGHALNSVTRLLTL